jgi:biopolymer transport protein ExbD
MSHNPPQLLANINTRRAKPISLTALIDVVFILLMFFMLTSSFSQWKAINLLTPSVNSQAENDAPPVVIIYVQDIGLLTDVLKRPIELLRIKHALPVSDSSLPIIVSAENSVSVQRFIDVHEKLKALGFSQIKVGPAIEDNAKHKTIAMMATP